MHVSIIIRTLNEARHLDQLLSSIHTQETGDFTREIVLVDSGSTDGTLLIAEKHGCLITHISREEFSFGRSLNRGCEAAQGDILVLVSGHCIPCNPHWLRSLCQPIADGLVDYSYGRQLGNEESQFSECQIFAKYFPAYSKLPQEGFFCNNANSALSRKAWETYRFDEEVTGLEDMELAKRLCHDGGRVGYVAEAAVHHLHDETWPQIKRRFEREALALQKIMPQIHLRHRDAARYISSSILHDWGQAIREKVWLRKAWSILLYRVNQYTGSLKGNRNHRKLSHEQKDKYFYPVEKTGNGPKRNSTATTTHGGNETIEQRVIE